MVLVEAKTTEGTTQGSGVVIGDRQVITNAHVVKSTVGLVTVRQGSASWQAVVENVDSDHDLAVLGLVLRRKEQFRLPIARQRGANTLSVGERVYAIGAPRGFEQTLSEGLISSLLKHDDQIFAIQTTASISPGSSGGGLFDSKGRIIGITTLYLRDSQNLNFAVASDYAGSLQSRPVQYEPLTLVRSEEAVPSLAGCMPASRREPERQPPELPTAVSTVQGVIIFTSSKGPVATAGGMTEQWIKMYVAARLRNRGIWVFENYDQASQARKRTLPLRVHVSSMNIDDTVLYPWQLELVLWDSTTLTDGSKGYVDLWSDGAFGYGGSAVVLQQVRDTLDAKLDALVKKMATP